ncbi:hypothetical protein AVEN_265970-1 [Araneus ventricosus]|uniref:Uncharacterized protein n=1 Tax=Araneus ventricosus TaxID=182803 RepID=A0A4Y2GHE3_ARAVE|nr:hypothetical protein AVEN_265970-1 [Araneus ventricosus]
MSVPLEWSEQQLLLLLLSCRRRRESITITKTVQSCARQYRDGEKDPPPSATFVGEGKEFFTNQSRSFLFQLAVENSSDFSCGDDESKRLSRKTSVIGARRWNMEVESR